MAKKPYLNLRSVSKPWIFYVRRTMQKQKYPAAIQWVHLVPCQVSVWYWLIWACTCSAWHFQFWSTGPQHLSQPPPNPGTPGAASVPRLTAAVLALLLLLLFRILLLFCVLLCSSFYSLTFCCWCSLFDCWCSGAADPSALKPIFSLLSDRVLPSSWL